MNVVHSTLLCATTLKNESSAPLENGDEDGGDCGRIRIRAPRRRTVMPTVALLAPAPAPVRTRKSMLTRRSHVSRVCESSRPDSTPSAANAFNWDSEQSIVHIFARRMRTMLFKETLHEAGRLIT